MSQAYVFGIGAIFLLAALLMFGTMTGFLPRVFHAGRTGPAILGTLLLGFVVIQYGPQIRENLSEGWNSIVDSGATTMPQPAAVTLPVARPEAQASPKRKPPNPPGAPLTERTPTPAEAGAPEPVEVIAVTAPAEPAAPPADSGEDPYDSGLKRAVKHVGRFLHIAKKKPQ